MQPFTFKFSPDTDLVGQSFWQTCKQAVVKITVIDAELLKPAGVKPVDACDCAGCIAANLWSVRCKVESSSQQVARIVGKTWDDKYVTDEHCVGWATEQEAIDNLVSELSSELKSCKKEQKRLEKEITALKK